MDKHTVRTISSGKSAQFPVLGTASTKYMTPGESIVETADYLQSIGHNEKIIHLDQFLTSSVMISQADELMNHYDVRAPYADAIGRALAKQMDTNIISTIAAAATTTTPNITGGKAGTILTGGVETSGSGLATFAFTAAQALDENDVPDDGQRYMIVRPAGYYAMAQHTDLVNRDLGGANGIYSEGTVLKCAGFTIIASNNMRSDDVEGVADDTAIRNDPWPAGDDVDYGSNVNFADHKAYFFHKSAVGTVKLQDLSVESEYQLERKANLFVASYMCGHGVLRPESAVILKG